MLLIAATFFAALCVLSIRVLHRDGHVRRALTWGPLWGVLFGFWSLGPQLAMMFHINQQSVAQWILLCLCLTIGFALLGLICAVPAGGFLTALQRMPVFRERSADWTFGLGMIAALPLAYIAIGVVHAAALGRIPALLMHDHAGIRALARDVATVGLAFIIYLRATRRGWTVAALAAPILAFALAGAGTLPIRVGRIPSMIPFSTPQTSPITPRLADADMLQRQDGSPTEVQHPRG